MTFHPWAKTFGKSTNTAFNSPTNLSMPTGWYARYAKGEACLASDTTYFLTHREFPIDIPVWHTRDAVACGEAAVVEAAKAWITAGGDGNLTLSAIVIRGVLRLPLSGVVPGTCVLLDVVGRSVMSLLPGANDVSRLSAGVYFLREEPQASNHNPHVVTVRKVVIVH